MRSPLALLALLSACGPAAPAPEPEPTGGDEIVAEAPTEDEAAPPEGPLPDGVTAAEGAAIGIPAGTAYQSLRSLGVGEGDVLLVHGGSGSVGQAAVQFAVAWGATVIATASPARHEQLRELGAIPVAYGDGLIDRVREAGTAPVTVVLDCAGTDEAIQVKAYITSLLQDEHHPVGKSRRRRRRLVWSCKS